MAVRCIRKNLSGWSAVMNRTPENTKSHVGSTSSLNPRTAEPPNDAGRASRRKAAPKGSMPAASVYFIERDDDFERYQEYDNDLQSQRALGVDDIGERGRGISNDRQ